MGEIMNMVAPAMIALVLAFFGIRVVIKSRADKKQALELLDEEPVEPEATSAVVIEKQVSSLSTSENKAKQKRPRGLFFVFKLKYMGVSHGQKLFTRPTRSA